MADEEEVASIPLVEERVEVTKKQVETGRLKVRISVDEREERVSADLSHDIVEIRRVPKGVPLSELPGVRLEGDTTIIPVVEEEVVIEKRLVLVEEIHVVRRSESSTREIPVTVRSEQAEVEREGETGEDGPTGGTARWQGQ